MKHKIVVTICNQRTFSSEQNIYILFISVINQIDAKMFGLQ